MSDNDWGTERLPDYGMPARPLLKGLPKGELPYPTFYPPEERPVMTAERFRETAREIYHDYWPERSNDAIEEHIAAALAEAVETERREIRAELQQRLKTEFRLMAPRQDVQNALGGILDLIDARGSR